VYRRAASAMLITSFTTMMAFVATAFSPLVEVLPSFREKKNVYPAE
jgi:hypothetical protein